VCDGFVDVDAVAQALLAQGYVVQVRDGCDKAKDSKSCLRTLRHRFIVCLGYQPALAHEPAYLPEPLLVEPRLRDQFVIAHPTPAYESLMQVGRRPTPEAWRLTPDASDARQEARPAPEPPAAAGAQPTPRHNPPAAHAPQAIPPTFVGPMQRLKDLVALVSDEMVGAFRQQNRALPPWRTRQAMLSKWSPAELAALAAQLAAMGRAARRQQGQQPAPGTPPAQHQAPALPPHMLQYLTSPQQQPQLPARPSSAPGDTSPLHTLAPMPAPPAAGRPHQRHHQQQQQQQQHWGFRGPPASAAAAHAAAGPRLPQPQPQPQPRRAPFPSEAPAGPMDSDSGGSPCSATSLSSADFMPQPVLALGGAQGPAAAAQLLGRPHQQRGRKQKSMLALALKNASRCPPAAPSGTGSAAGSSASAASGGNNYIRTLEEPWARITTVRWGAYAAQAAAEPAVPAATS
jgi:hypothetical protein